MHLFERIKEERYKKKHTQQNVMDICGVSERTQNNYESGETSPNADYLLKLYEKGYDIKYIITGERDYTNLNYNQLNLLDFYAEASPECREMVFELFMVEQSGGDPEKQNVQRKQLIHNFLSEKQGLLISQFNQASAEIQAAVWAILMSNSEITLKAVAGETGKGSKVGRDKGNKVSNKVSVKGNNNITAGGDLKK